LGEKRREWSKDEWKVERKRQNEREGAKKKTRRTDRQTEGETLAADDEKRIVWERRWRWKERAKAKSGG
jgi:hypothetical protein